jgi:hypothetical protein
VTSDLIARWATWAARSTPIGTEPGSLDALEAATEIAIKRLDAAGVDFTIADLQDEINDRWKGA